MSPGRTPTLVRGPTMARARFGPSKVQGGSTDDLKAAAVEKIIADIVGGRADPAEIAFAPCEVVRDVVIGTPTAALAADPAIKAVIQAKAEDCRDQGDFSFEAGFWDRLALSAPADALAGFIEGFTLGGVFEVVGNGIIAMTGGLMIWLGAQRTFSRVRR